MSPRRSRSPSSSANPTPDNAARLGEKRSAAFSAQHSYCGRRAPAELLARLRAAPAGQAGESETEISGELVRGLAVVLAALVAEIAKLTARLEHAPAALPDSAILMSFPCAGCVGAAQILAELGPTPTLAPGYRLLCRQPAPHLALGGQDVPRRLSTRLRSAVRHPHPQARLDARPVKRLDPPPTLRPSTLPAVIAQ